MTLTEYVLVTAGAVIAGLWWYAQRKPSPSELEPMSKFWLADKNHHRREH